MANMRLSMATRNALVSVYSGLIDGAGDAGTISFYTGPQPPTADASRLTRGQTLLATLSFAVPSAGPPENGTIEFAPSQQALMSASSRGMAKASWIVEADSAEASGKVEWARVQDGNGNVVFDCDVSGPGGGATIEINSADIVQGGPIRVQSMMLSFPAG